MPLKESAAATPKDPAGRPDEEAASVSVLSDLVRRWLEPEDLPEQSERGKQLSNDLIDQVDHYDPMHQRSTE